MTFNFLNKKLFSGRKESKCAALSILILFLFISPVISFSQNVTARIKLNQSGFYPNAPKLAVLTDPDSATVFYITSTNLRDTVFTGKLSEEKQSAYSNTKTKIADFSSLKIKGSFVVCVPNAGHSYVFEINDNVDKKAVIATLKGFYYQRVSMSLEEKYAGKWHRSAGHPDGVVLIHSSAATKERPEGTVISSRGGWYDAGDYNKYIINSGITMGTLLSAYEDFPLYFKNVNTNIPESADAIPDILNEVVYNLRWMLTMQDPFDGGVYNKCTNASFDGMVMPGVTKAARYVVQKGTAATLDFVAVTAQASRILKNFKQFSNLSDSCLKASKNAWKWAVANPGLEYNQAMMNKKFKPEISTGGYGDKNFNDEWFWAASELYITTMDKRFYDSLKNFYSDKFDLPGWSNVYMLGCYSLLRFKENRPSFTNDLLSQMQQNIIKIADGFINNVTANAFNTIMGQSTKDFSWGGNSVAANQGILLVNGYLLTHEKKYLENALTNVDYLLGRNATGYSFITGIGSKSPMFPHHRQSTADGVTDPVPGLLVGGPNPGMQDKCHYEFTEPETAYSDQVCSYASNEIAINWNAPAVYLLSAIEALQDEFH